MRYLFIISLLLMISCEPLPPPIPVNRKPIDRDKLHYVYVGDTPKDGNGHHCKIYYVTHDLGGVDARYFYMTMCEGSHGNLNATLVLIPPGN